MRSARRRRLRAALYHRVSTREQNRRLARAELRGAATARGLRVVVDVEYGERAIVIAENAAS